jgi:hypothetical protein
MPMLKAVRLFIIDYLSRHRNNVNRITHLLGVPLAFYGIYQIFTIRFRDGALNLFIGYLLQYIGHTYYEKNEVGEWILIKKIAGKIMAITKET